MGRLIRLVVLVAGSLRMGVSDRLGLRPMAVGWSVHYGGSYGYAVKFARAYRMQR